MNVNTSQQAYQSWERNYQQAYQSSERNYQRAYQSWERNYQRATAMRNAMLMTSCQRGDPYILNTIERRPPWWQRRARRRFDLHARIARLEREVL